MNGNIKNWLQIIFYIACIVGIIASTAVTYAQVEDNQNNIKDQEIRLREVEEAVMQLEFIREDISDIKTDLWYIRKYLDDYQKDR